MTKDSPSKTTVIGTVPEAEVICVVTVKVIVVPDTEEFIPVGLVPTTIEVGVIAVLPLYDITFVVVLPPTAVVVVPAKV